MNLEIEKFKVSLDYNEATEIYWGLYHALERTIDTHWKDYPDVYQQQSACKRHIMGELARVIGVSTAYQEEALLDRLKEFETTNQ